MKILVVEDDADISEFIKEGFRSEGYTVDTALQGLQGSYLARTNSYDVIILDHSLPLKNGLDVCREVRASGSSVPIIFLSVMSDTRKKIEALTQGADDYLTKPFFFEELKARVQALRRRPAKIQNPLISAGDLTLNMEKRIVERRGKTIYLTRKEYSLLEYLMRNAGIALSRSMIMEHVWSADSDPFSNTVEAHILNLRKKLQIGRSPEVIRNVPGRGYIIEV